MKNFLENAKIFSCQEKPYTVVSFNSHREKHDVFSMVEMDLTEDNIFVINSVANKGYSFLSLLLKGDIKQNYLEKLRHLSLQEVSNINEKLEKLNNPAKIYEKCNNYIIIEYENDSYVNLDELLNVFYDFCKK